MSAGVKSIDKNRVIDKDTTKILLTFWWLCKAIASATLLLMATGKPNWVMVITKIRVGNAILYKPTPSAPMNLAKTMRLMNPSTLVISPAAKRIKVPFRNLDNFLPYLLK